MYFISFRVKDVNAFGNTSQILASRVRQHRSDTRFKPHSTHLAAHVNDVGHQFNYDKVRISERQKDIVK